MKKLALLLTVYIFPKTLQLKKSISLPGKISLLMILKIQAEDQIPTWKTAPVIFMNWVILNYYLMKKSM